MTYWQISASLFVSLWVIHCALISSQELFGQSLLLHIHVAQVGGEDKVLSISLHPPPPSQCPSIYNTLVAIVLHWTSDLTSQYSVIVSLKYLNYFYTNGKSNTCIYSVYYIFWVALLFPVPWSCNYNSPICISKHVFQDFSLSIITTDDQINLDTLIECFQRLYMQWKNHNIDINTCIK